jgi:hypothetical protein
MNDLSQRKAARIVTKGHPSRLADDKLAHLDKVIRHAARSGVYTPVHGLDLAYWHRRIGLIEDAFDLLPVQKSRIKALLCLLKSLTVEELCLRDDDV